MTRAARHLLPWLGVLALAAGSASSAHADPRASDPARFSSTTHSAGAEQPAVPSGGDRDTTWPQITGERLIGTPTSKPCVENIVKDYAFKNTAYGPDKNFTGPYDPPTRCPGRWARVVATISVHVTGVQFDRLGDLRLGDTDVFAYSTAEPRGDGAGEVTWTKSKDITDYTDLLMHHQKLSFEIGNVITGPYDGGVFYGSLRLSLLSSWTPTTRFRPPRPTGCCR